MLTRGGHWDVAPPPRAVCYAVVVRGGEYPKEMLAAFLQQQQQQQQAQPEGALGADADLDG